MSLSVFDAAVEAPERIALVAGDRSLTWANLADEARLAIRWLRRHGLAGAPLVALTPTNDPASITMLLALVALRTPVLMLHPRLTATERRTLLERHGLERPVDAGWRRDIGAADPEGAAGLEGAAERGRASGPEGAPDYHPDDHPQDGENPLAILSTSGTTGAPRSVVLSHRAFIASAEASAANLGWEDDDRWLLRLPVAHVGGLSVVTRCLLARRTVVLSDDRDPRDLARTIERHRVTILSLVPTLLGRMLDLDPAWDPPAHVRAILLGGAAASPALLTRAADRGWPVLTTYGLTEACSQVTTQPYGTVNRGELGSGRPLPGTDVRIGPDAEIQVRGPMLLSGYVPEEGFPADSPPPPDLPTGPTPPQGPSSDFGIRPGALVVPFLDDGWFPTGDHGRLDDRGCLHVSGRRSDRIVTGGENVDPVEVEQALERLPGIRQACVFGVPDEEWGAVVAAAIVAEPGFDPAVVQHGLADALATFKRPRRLAVVDALVTNRNGKVDREATAKAALTRLNGT